MCLMQNCPGYDSYLKRIPPAYRVCNSCKQEMLFYSQFGNPFTYRQYEETNYPIISYGKELNFLATPKIDINHFYDIFIVICSSANQLNVRKKLRTRLEQLKERFNFGYIFALGYNKNNSLLIQQESYEYKDIIQLAHKDSYHHLTLSVFGAFQYLTHFQNITKYFMKTDSDCVINFELIVHYVQQTSTPYFGNCRYWDYYITSKRDKRYLKMYVPKQLVQNDTKMPSYATGAGYLIRSDLLKYMIIALRHVNFIAHNEDVNVGKAMQLLGYNCSYYANWVARHGCDSKEECSNYAILHKKESDDEIPRLWSYVL